MENTFLPSHSGVYHLTSVKQYSPSVRMILYKYSVYNLFSSAGIRQEALAVLVQNTPAMAFWEKRGYSRGARYLDNEGDDVYAYLLSRPFAYLEEDALVTCTRISLREGSMAKGS
jgi:hypothetical protein